MWRQPPRPSSARSEPHLYRGRQERKRVEQAFKACV
jgi:hypothetical protein